MSATDSVHPAVASRLLLQQQQRGAEPSPTAGCCLIKELISNLLNFATRSRRKAADLNKAGGGVNNVTGGVISNNSGGLLAGEQLVATCPSSSSACKKTGVVSFSKAGSAKLARKATQSVDTCVADSLDDAMLDKMCAIPTGMDSNEWLATQTLAMFDHCNALCGTVSDTCTPVTCAIMSYPGVSKASWVDEKGKRHHYSAMRYIDSVMSFCEASRKNQSLFPTKFGARFSADFEAHCRRMTRLLWHCCGHLYAKHWDQLATLNLRPQFGLVLAHMTRMAKIYGLLDTKEFSLITNTMQAIRPTALTNPSQSMPSSQSRPTKRLNTDNDSGGVVLPPTFPALPQMVYSTAAGNQSYASSSHEKW
uniref:Mob1/phocein family protein n=1 Tax=Ditylenchus dipsaci TaxID=166011 RepID=A0A915ED28_9BILA